MSVVVQPLLPDYLHTMYHWETTTYGHGYSYGGQVSTPCRLWYENKGRACMRVLRQRKRQSNGGFPRCHGLCTYRAGGPDRSGWPLAAARGNRKKAVDMVPRNYCPRTWQKPPPSVQSSTCHCLGQDATRSRIKKQERSEAVANEQRQRAPNDGLFLLRQRLPHWFGAGPGHGDPLSSSRALLGPCRLVSWRGELERLGFHSLPPRS